MALDFISIGIGIVVLIIYLAILFLLFEIKARMLGGIRMSFVYFIIAVLLLIARRIQQIFYQSDLFSVPYLYDLLSILFAILLFLAVYTFYKFVVGSTKKKKFGNPINKYRGRFE